MDDAVTQPIVIVVPHQLGREEAARRLNKGLSNLTVGRFNIDIAGTWTGDRLDFTLAGMGQQVTGTADVSDTSVRVELNLPWFLRGFAGALQGAIQVRAKNLLSKRA